MRSVFAPSKRVARRLHVEERLEVAQVGGQRVDELGLDRVLDDRVAVLVDALCGVSAATVGASTDQRVPPAATVLGMAVYALGDLEPQIDPEAFVHPDATVIGNVTIGPESTIWPQAVLRGDNGSIIGRGADVDPGRQRHPHRTTRHPTVIGDDCVIGHLVHMECCTIEDGALVGSGSIVLHRRDRAEPRRSSARTPSCRTTWRYRAGRWRSGYPRSCGSTP